MEVFRWESWVSGWVGRRSNGCLLGKRREREREREKGGYNVVETSGTPSFGAVCEWDIILWVKKCVFVKTNMCARM